LNRYVSWVGAFAILFLGAQLMLAFHLRPVAPRRDLLPPAPSERVLNAQALGDTQFLFRIYALQMQNAGDTGGRVVPIKNYDFSVVIDWLRVLQTLDYRSVFPGAIAARYYGFSQDTSHARPVIEFISENVELYPKTKWRLLQDAVYLAQRRLQDERLALRLARQLASYGLENTAVWAAIMPAVILENLEEYSQALAFVDDFLQREGKTLGLVDLELTREYQEYLAKRVSEQKQP
jgi:hypothetical protein